MQTQILLMPTQLLAIEPAFQPSEMVSLPQTGWPGIHWVAQGDLKLLVSFLHQTPESRVPA